MNAKLRISYNNIIKQILNDSILTNITKESLIEYSKIDDIHTSLHVTFSEVLYYVWQIINNHGDKDQIKSILNEEMKDSLCKCFTERLSRLINCLNGFDDRICIKISESNEISNIIILIKNNKFINKFIV